MKKGRRPDRGETRPVPRARRWGPALCTPGGGPGRPWGAGGVPWELGRVVRELPRPPGPGGTSPGTHLSRSGVQLQGREHGSGPPAGWGARCRRPSSARFSEGGALRVPTAQRSEVGPGSAKPGVTPTASAGADSEPGQPSLTSKPGLRCPEFSGSALRSHLRK